MLNYLEFAGWLILITWIASYVFPRYIMPSLHPLCDDISKQMTVDYIQGIRHDDDVDDAKVAGLVEGKNSVIDKSKLELREGDDLPTPKNSGTPKPEPQRESLLGSTRLNPANYMQKIS